MLKTDSIQITPEILSVIAKIDEFKGAWRALGTLAPDRPGATRLKAPSLRPSSPGLRAMTPSHRNQDDA